MHLNDLINLLSPGDEQNTARIMIHYGEVTLADGTTQFYWNAQLEYFHDDDFATAGGFGVDPDGALADLTRMVTVGRMHEVGQEVLDDDGRVVIQGKDRYLDANKVPDEVLV